MRRGKNMIRIIQMTIMLAVLFIPVNVRAQGVTYSHDDAKMNQITVAEIGSGSLTPDLYYQLLHNSYKKSASAKNKMSFRTLAGINLYNQIDDATALDSAMIKRAEIEALNIADRSGGALDVAWLAEGDKLNAKMAALERNIWRILEIGGTASEQEYWMNYYRVYQSSIHAMQQAYMPNVQRKKQYLRIYADVARTNETLVFYLVRLSKSKTTRELLAAANAIDNHKAQVVAEAMNRWRSAGWHTVAHQ